jgi:large subunit ribosomal protein L15
VFRDEFSVVNLDRLEALGVAEITPESLRKAGVIKGKQQVKILGTGELKTALNVKAHKFSKTAQEKITKAGGKFEVLQ